MDKKIAILGATGAQRELYEKARKLGLKIIGISRPEDAVCSQLADKFYPISIAERERVVEICRKECVNGVVSNGSEFSIKIVAFVAEQLHLDGTPLKTILRIQDKEKMRELSERISGLTPIRHYVYNGISPEEDLFPCIVKPVPSAAKCGLSLAHNKDEFYKSVAYANQQLKYDKLLIEEFVNGREVSVETISYRGNHYVIQITDKITTGAPHFVELEHHQPSSLSKEIQMNIHKLIPELLDGVNFVTGATHTELKIASDGKIFLIEINPRGGGGYISSQLVELSTGYDFISAMILASLGKFELPILPKTCYSGIYYLCHQTRNLLPFFSNAHFKNGYRGGGGSYIRVDALTESTGNNDRDGYIIYQADRKIKPEYLSDPILISSFPYKDALDFVSSLNLSSGIYSTKDHCREVSCKWLRFGEVVGIMNKEILIAQVPFYCNNTETRIAYIHDVFVLAKFRKRGLAYSMMKYAHNIITSRGFDFVHLHVAKNNIPAQKLYSSLGYCAIKEDNALILMEKKLNLEIDK